MNARATASGSIAGSMVCRGIVPLWLATGAAIKLAERSPMLLPSPVRDTLRAVAGMVGRGDESHFASFLDGVLRVIVAGEFTLAAAMIALPALSRRIAIPLLSLFVLILLAVVARGEASCGCFGSKGPSPLVVLACDAVLLALALFTRPIARPLTRNHLALFTVLAMLGAGISFAVPARQGVAAVQETPLPPQGAPEVQRLVFDAKSGSWVPIEQNARPDPASSSATTTAVSPWPSPPTQLQPYYLPQFEQWVGKRLRDQPIAALVGGPLPSDLERGRWIVMFFREDCEHCHAVLDRHFSPKVPLPTLLVSVPDADPAARLPNPCGECQVRTLPKGPDWIIGTPVLVSIEDGVVKGQVGGTDAEDPDKVQALIEFR